MVDPFTAVAAASKAFAVVKACVEAGREAEDVMMQVGQWYGHASDVMYASQKAKNPPLFKRITHGKSIEAEAIQIFAMRKKVEAQQRDLVTLLKYTYGNDGLQEFRELKKQVANERKRAVYAQQERRELVLGCILIGFGVAILVGLVMLIASAVK